MGMLLRRLLLAGVGLCTFAAHRPYVAFAQETCNKQFAVSRVGFERETSLTPSEQATIRSRLVGRCFDETEVGGFTYRVRDTLQTFGYLRATVSEPTLTIIDATQYPEPVSLTFDVAEGARYKVRDIVWSGMKAVDADQLFAISLNRPEDILDTSKVRATIEGTEQSDSQMHQSSRSFRSTKPGTG